MNLVLLVLYATAFVVYAMHFARRKPAVGRAATTVLLFAAIVHTFVVGMQTMEVRHVPVTNASAAISTCVWLLTLSYLYLELSTDERSMGVFILPIIVALQIIPTVSPGIENPNPVFESKWFWVHISSLLFAYASFALACVLGLTYMLQFKEIKKKHLGYLYTRLPSLQILDDMNSRAVVIGWVFLTVGVVVGYIWAAQASVTLPDDRNLRAMSLADPKVFGAVLTWAVYSFAMFARQRLGWNGRRAAWLSAVGFVIILLNFVPVSYFVQTSHTFQ
ncbi:MAG TPA: cytochrome c biogenesis protein CcsA [Vicinamibacterales bacterium]|nr:cytochrome c biogenesis protein CcsA [Vicinamibacterales bacterium]